MIVAKKFTRQHAEKDRKDLAQKLKYIIYNRKLKGRIRTDLKFNRSNDQQIFKKN